MRKLTTAISTFVLVACIADEAPQAFDDDENDDTLGATQDGKDDGSSVYRNDASR